MAQKEIVPRQMHDSQELSRNEHPVNRSKSGVRRSMLKGRKKAVILDYPSWQDLLNLLEDL